MARNYSSVVEPKTLTANVGISDTQITLNNVTGLPSTPYVLVLNPDTNKEEAVLVTVDQTGVTSPTLKVQRAIEASGGVGVATTHSIGHIVKHMIVGSDLQIVHDHFSNESTTAGTAHGATGGVVGRTNSQTLTNKTINLTDNTLTGTKAQFNAALSDADFATIAGTETLTNKTLTSPVITGGTVNGGAALTVDSTELNTLDGITSSAAELNILDGATLTTTELNYVDGVTSAIQTQLTTNTPVGAVTMWVTGTAPTGWFLCNGNAVSRTTYSALFAVIGTTYGTGDNTTTFNLPDLLGRVPMGAGSGTGLTTRTLGTELGSESTTLDSTHIPQHSHTINHGHTASASTSIVNDGTHTHQTNIEIAGSLANGGIYLLESNTTPRGNYLQSGGDHSHGASTSVTVDGHTGSSGNYGTASPTAVTAVQPSTVINFIIKF